MRTTVLIFSTDELETTDFGGSPYSPEFPDNVFPLKKPESIETCKKLWEGEMPVIPNDGETVYLPGRNNCMFVVDRVFHFDDDKTLRIAIFVSSESVVEDEEESDDE